MKQYRLDTYHGPVVLTQRATSWEIRSSALAPEEYPGEIPFWCRTRAREISAAAAEELLAEDDGLGEGWAWSRLERAS